MKFSKRAVAREWLIFLALLVLGLMLSSLITYSAPPAERSSEEWLGRAIGLWFLLYLSVMLIRSIWWSIKVVNISKRARYGIAVFIAVIVAAVGGAIAIKNTVDHRQDVAKSKSTPERTPEFDLDAYLAKNMEKVEEADLRKIILFDVTYQNPIDAYLAGTGVTGAE